MRTCSQERVRTVQTAASSRFAAIGAARRDVKKLSRERSAGTSRIFDFSAYLWIAHLWCESAERRASPTCPMSRPATADLRRGESQTRDGRGEFVSARHGRVQDRGNST